MKVFVWHNHWGTGALNHPGHAALAINGTDTPDHYISYWPQGLSLGKKQGTRVFINRPLGDFDAELGNSTRQKLNNGDFKPRDGQTNDLNIRVGGYNIPNRHAIWVQLPNTIEDVPVADPENGTIGLDVERIIAWWKIVSMDIANWRYRKVSSTRNCSAIVMSALFAGGAKAFESPPHHYMYYHPNDVAQYARNLNVKIAIVQQASDEVNKARRHRRSFARDGRSFDMDIVPPRVIPELPTVRQWKKDSFVRFGRRKEQVFRMDGYLTEYWRLGERWTATNEASKGVALRNLILQIAEHLRKKPKSNRRKAVLNLGVEVIRVIQDRAASSTDTRNRLQPHVGQLL